MFDALKSSRAELIAIYGRRRVGKTFMVRQAFEKEMVFEFSGTLRGSFKQQLTNFSRALSEAFKTPIPLAMPVSWSDALNGLRDFLMPMVTKRRTVIFFDEFPWIHTPRSGFLEAFDYWWNTWASRYPNLVVVICGSAAAWMIKHVV
ncbi:MAG: ATP-binding protein, partial [Chitinophagaceae bacterium]|nr:ATP-binding protein [Chitinophagaceae bacterium]